MTDHQPPPLSAQPRSLMQRLRSGLDWLFGALALIGLLAGCSVIPVLNFLSLGYLLHVSGKVASTGRIRDGFVGVRTASILGSVAVGAWLALWPLRFVSGLWQDAELIAPGSARAQAWHIGTLILAGLTLIHILWSTVRGGKIWHFLWPQPIKFIRWLGQDGKWQGLAGTATDYVMRLRLPYCFWLGVKGFTGAAAWLAVPVLMMFAATKMPAVASGFVSFIGGALLAVVAMYLPFLQTHQAMTGRFKAVFERSQAKEWFKRAPFAFWLALLVTLLLAVPLYFLKIELTPRDLAWLPSVVFVLFMFPARVLAGWAVSRAQKRELPRHKFAQWTARLASVPVVLFYAIVVYVTQYLTWNGAMSLLEQHAFLVPAPLMAL